MEGQGQFKSEIYNLSKWKYSEIRDALNNSEDPRLLQACKEEFYRRVEVYKKWKIRDVQEGRPQLRFAPDAVTYPEKNETGIFTSLYKKRLVLHNFELQLWIVGVGLLPDIDNCGDFKKFEDLYIPNSDGVLMLYDISKMSTFMELKKLLKAVRTKHPRVPICIVGAKSNLKDCRQVTQKSAKEFAEKENLDFFECNIKNQENIKEVLEHLTYETLQMKQTRIPKKVETEGKCVENYENKLVPNVKEKHMLESKTLSGSVNCPITEIKGSSQQENVMQNAINDKDNCILVQELNGNYTTEAKCPFQPQDTSATQEKGDNSKRLFEEYSQLSHKICSLELNESCNIIAGNQCQPSQSVAPTISEKEEMLLEGKCPSWFA